MYGIFAPLPHTGNFLWIYENTSTADYDSVGLFCSAVSLLNSPLCVYIVKVFRNIFSQQFCYVLSCIFQVYFSTREGINLEIWVFDFHITYLFKMTCISPSIADWLSAIRQLKVVNASVRINRFFFFSTQGCFYPWKSRYLTDIFSLIEIT